MVQQDEWLTLTFGIGRLLSLFLNLLLFESFGLLYLPNVFVIILLCIIHIVHTVKKTIVLCVFVCAQLLFEHSKETPPLVSNDLLCAILLL